MLSFSLPRCRSWLSPFPLPLLRTSWINKKKKRHFNGKLFFSCRSRTASFTWLYIVMNIDLYQVLQSPGESPLLYGEVYGMPFGLPWQQVGSISLAHCDSWEILCLDVFYGCVLVG